MEIIAHTNIFKSGELDEKHMFRFGTYGICATGVMSSSSERPKIPTTITTTPELHRIVKSVPEARTRKQLADKRNKLKTADRQLAELQDELDALTEKRDNAQSDYHELTSKHQEQIRMRLTDAVFGRLIVDIRELFAAMPSELKANVNGEFLTAIAEQPNEILKCAMYLFLGYLDGATQFAQSCGGGGTSSDLPWGRNPNEDDRRFAYRCMMQAHKMLKPSQPKRVIGRRY